MKKILLIATLMLSAAGISAQPKAGTFSIIPRLGVCLATTNDELNYSTNQTLSAKYKAGFVGGVDFDYQATSMLSVSAGVFYSMQGSRFGSAEEETGIKNQKEGIENSRLNLSYLNVPILANVYIAEGLAVKAGVQLDFALDGKYEWDATLVEKKEDGSYVVSTTESQTTDFPQKNFGLSIPVGISYEYMNVVLDARYNFGLGNIQDAVIGNVKKNSFMFTVGYRFAL